MATFASDNCNDTDGVALQSHTPSGGGTWTEHASLATGGMEIRSNRVRHSGGFNPSLFYISGTPGGTDPEEYDVSADATILSDNDGINGVSGRIDTGANTRYDARLRLVGGGSNMSIQLVQVVAGVVTQLGSSTLAQANGRVTLEMRNSAKRALLDGVEQATSADNTITAAGLAGLFDAGSNAGTATGVHWDDFEAVDLDVGGGAALNKETLVGSALIGSFLVRG